MENQSQKKKKRPLEIVLDRLASKGELLWVALSFFLSVLLWAYIASEISPGFEAEFSDIPVAVDITGTKAEEYELSVISQNIEDPKIDVTLIGNRSDLGGLKKEDISAYVDFDAMLTNTVGKQVLPIKIRTKAAYTSAELSIPTMEITMDRYEDASFNVTDIDHKNIKTTDSETIKDIEAISCSPMAVKIKGPTAALALIDHIKLVIDEEETIEQTKIFTNITHYELIGKDGSRLDETPFNVENTRYSVTIPVYYMRTLPITIGVDKTGITKNFDMDWLKERLRIVADTEYTLPGFGDNNKMITLRTNDISHKTMLMSWTEYLVGNVPLSSLAPIDRKNKDSKEYSLTVSPEEGFEDLSNIGTIKVVLDETDLITVTRGINNDEIRPMNGLADYDYTVAPGRTMITLIGPSDEISKIAASDLRAVVLLYNSGVNDAGSFSEGVTVTLPDDCPHVWVSPMPKVTVTAKAKETTASS